MKKLTSKQKKELDEAVKIVMSNPCIGDQKKGDLNFLWVITPRLTVAPIPVVDLPYTCWKIFIGYGSEFELTSGSAQVFGEVLTLK